MKNILLFSTIILLLAGCTKVGEPPMHPSGWLDAESDDSHMAKIVVASTKTCRPCHGGLEKHDFFGGTSGVSCYECHAGGPSGHPAFNLWVGSPESSDFHGKDNPSRCVSCHGKFNDEDGGLAEVSCYACHETI